MVDEPTCEGPLHVVPISEEGRGVCRCTKLGHADEGIAGKTLLIDQRGHKVVQVLAEASV